MIGLFRAEARRFAGRRLFRWLALLSVVGFVGLMVYLAAFQFGRPTESLLAQAKVKRDSQVVQMQQGREQCLKDMTANPPPSVDGQPAAAPEMLCGPEVRAEDIPLDHFLPKQTFTLAGYLPSGATAVAVIVAVLLFVVGASFIGAEWHHRTLMAELFWEPRRLRVLFAKAFVLGQFALFAAIVAQALWYAAAWVMSGTSGDRVGMTGEVWRIALNISGRGVILGVLFALLGFAVAHLNRGTGAALGVAFAYTAVVETGVQLANRAWAQWLLTTNVQALISHKGTTITVPGHFVGPKGEQLDYKDIVLSNLHGGLVLGGTVAVLLLIGAVLFKRRDLT